MPSSSIKKAKTDFGKIISSLNDEELREFIDYVKEAISQQEKIEYYHNYKNELIDELEREKEEDRIAQANEKLNKIVLDLRKKLPLNAEAPDETITIPKHSKEFEGFTKDNTVNVDSFLYDEKALDDLEENENFSFNYCADCLSRNIKPLNFISHSASIVKLNYLFNVALKNDIKNIKNLVDVGSRLGAVLYCAYYYTPIENIIGVELNPTFSRLTNNVIKDYNMDENRIKVYCDNILNRATELQNADIVVLNNVFQFFIKKVAAQRKLWNFLHDNITKKGTIIIAMPSLEMQLAEVNSTIKLDQWLESFHTERDLSMYEEAEAEDIMNMYFYRVK
ncbi:hypothetical protein H8356DRAFT_1701690 [Neocallimastix lanati (nom. inval.)]|jgi:hypothetical protein|uniref:Methyltransferase type 11 domain-containing protein n=1 Tax=Neocallimastix californiae TaxID=1754190 RepID=A0A1Y2AT88_9FUNG|nr:hypothetical protein H8356DRAFT_1701690 [Neocallimastix sp. JGI-2020a]ORY25510.1 hypothetical protein LY90DRAFT_674850 [Neocallimastix californiae]|eukprot:ORY25510.1 hypothetical protein LY90DRAFT_674850 [Neocallimastix californiae]